MASRWDHLLDSKPVPVADYVLTEVSKLFAKDLSKWPFEIEDASAEVTALLEGKRPGPLLLREAFRLARWDLQREHEAYDDYMRNRRFVEAGLVEADRALLLFVSTFVQEQLLAFAEATKGKVKRPGLLHVLDLTERAVLKVETV